jgi:hypothetical protein
VNSALTRARSKLEETRQVDRQPSTSPFANAIVARFVRAYEGANVEELVALFTDDVFLSMPPMPLEYEGRDVVARFFEVLLIPGRRYSLIPTRANGAPAVGSYVLGPDGQRHATGLFVVTIDGERISAMTRFEKSELAWFGLPLTLSGV